MCKRLLCVLLVLVCAGVGFAEIYQPFENGGGDGLWRNPANWQLGHVPTTAEYPIHVTPGATLIIDSLTNASVKGFSAGYVGETHTNMTGGTLDVANVFQIGATIYGMSYFDMSGGTLTAGTHTYIGLSDGTLTVNASTLTGAVINTPTLHLGGYTNDHDFGFLNVWGGTVNGGDLYLNEWGAHTPGEDRIDLRNGKEVAQLVLNGDLVSHPIYGDVMAYWISVGYFTAYNGAGTVMYDYDVTNPGKTTVWGVPEPATMVLLGLGGLGLLRRKHS